MVFYNHFIPGLISSKPTEIHRGLPDTRNQPPVSQYSGICNGIAIKPDEMATRRSRRCPTKLRLTSWGFRLPHRAKNSCKKLLLCQDRKDLKLSELDGDQGRSQSNSGLIFESKNQTTVELQPRLNLKLVVASQPQ